MFASNSLELSFKLFLLTDVGNCCKERETKLSINIYTKISRNLGSSFLDFRQFFQLLFCIPVSNFPAFYEHNRNRSICPTFVEITFYGKRRHTSVLALLWELVIGMEVNAHHTEKLLKEINRALLPCQYQSEKLSLQSYELPAALTFRWVNAILIVLLKYY